MSRRGFGRGDSCVSLRSMLSLLPLLLWTLGELSSFRCRFTGVLLGRSGSATFFSLCARHPSKWPFSTAYGTRVPHDGHSTGAPAAGSISRDGRAREIPLPTIMSAKPQISSEDVLNQKIDLCISNTIVKTGIGFSAGVVLSVLLLRRRTWPVWLGTGFGLGAGYTDCERSFNPVAVPGVRLVPASEAAANPGTTFQVLQQRVGEFVGSAKDTTKNTSNDESAQLNVQNIRDAAQNRFSELSNAAGEQVQHLKDGTQHVIEELGSRTQDVRNDLADAIRASPEGEEKVRKL